MTHTGKNVGGVAFDFHAATAAVALLPAPEVAVEESLVDFQSGGHAGKEGDERLAVGLPGSEVAQHKRSIVPDAGWDGDCVGYPRESRDVDFSQGKREEQRLQLWDAQVPPSGFETNSRRIAEILWPTIFRFHKEELCAPTHGSKTQLPARKSGAPWCTTTSCCARDCAACSKMRLTWKSWRRRGMPPKHYWP